MKFKNSQSNPKQLTNYNLAIVEDGHLDKDMLLTYTNYTRLNRVAKSEELLSHYWIDAAFLMHVANLYPELCNKWYGSVYVTINQMQYLVFTTPEVTIEVSQRDITCVTNHDSSELSTLEIEEGLIPILDAFVSISRIVKDKHIASQKDISK